MCSYSFILCVTIALFKQTVCGTVNYPVATTPMPQIYDSEEREGRGMMMDYDHVDVHDHDDHDHDHIVEHKEEQKAVKTDIWSNYYNFIIQEGSFKFWAAFQLGTAILLIYSAFAAIYYAKFNVISTDYDYYDAFFGRSSARSSSSSSSGQWFGLSSDVVQRIYTALTSKKFS
ncbi:uncharacterized protein [Onthophagus taurus]|uniref:uncharacterized protein n=1 Tax=Onthophagus taurus TaxID=166361 RepID=UPI000C20109C|nr:uncharacterized protein LOC111425611 [Onthophagus taurus]